MFEGFFGAITAYILSLVIVDRFDHYRRRLISIIDFALRKDDV